MAFKKKEDIGIRPVPQLIGFPRKFSSFLRFQKYRSDEVSVSSVIVALDGTGDYDDIQAAIDSLPDTGGQVLIKPGTYTITSKITIDKNNVLITGSGLSTIINTTSNIVMFYIGNVSAVTNISISNLKIVGSGAGNEFNVGIWLKECSNSWFGSCSITNCGMTGIILGPADDCVRNDFFSLDCSDNLGNGMACQAAGDNHIYNCRFTSNVDHGISIINFLGDSSHNTIDNNTILDNIRFGVRIDGDCNFNLITNNIFAGNIKGPIQDLGTNTQIGHNITYKPIQ